MMKESQIPNVGSIARLQTVVPSSQPFASTEKMLNDIADYLSGFLGDVSLIRLCSLWVAQAHLGHVWSICPWLYVGLPGHDQGGQLLLDVLQPLMPVNWYAGGEPELPRQATLRNAKAVPGCRSKVVADFLQRLGAASRVSALIGHVVDPRVGKGVDSARRALVLTGMPSWRTSAELATKAITYATSGVGSARVLCKSDVLGGYSLRVDLDEWVIEVEDAAGQANTILPDGLSGANADLWRPMLTLAELAGEEWHAWATQLAVQDALSKSYAALGRLSDSVVDEECGMSTSSWHKSEEEELLAQVGALRKTRERTLAHMKADSVW